MVDANQRWDVNEAVAWMRELVPFKPLWIEEPTSPDDVLGHLAIAHALNPLGGSLIPSTFFKQHLKHFCVQLVKIK